MGRIGVCSWSLAGKNAEEMVRAARACGVEGVQIALDPIRQGPWDAADVAARLREAGLALLSGMMATQGEDYSTLDSIRRTGGLRPDEHWPANLEAARRNADLAGRLGLKLVTMHAGFLPEVASGFRPMGTVASGFRPMGGTVASGFRPMGGAPKPQPTPESLDAPIAQKGDATVASGFRPMGGAPESPAASGSPIAQKGDATSIARKGDATERAKLLDRLAQIARIFESRGVTLGLETGQETAATLLEVLASPGLERVGVNFDPGNMILYGMGEPVEALRALAGRVVQLHVKDALPAPPERPGEWGQEVPAGQGTVNWPALLGVVKEAGLDVDLVIEREAGPSRIEDVRTARALLQGLLRKENL